MLAKQKALNVFFYLFPTYFVGAYVASKNSAQGFVVASQAVSILAMMVFVGGCVTFVGVGVPIHHVFGGNYLITGELLGCAILLMLPHVLRGAKLEFILSVLLFSVLFIIGGRGPLLGVILSIFLFFLYKHFCGKSVVSNYRKWIVGGVYGIISFMAIGIVVYWFSPYVFSGSTWGPLLEAFSGHDASLAERWLYWRESWRMFTQNPLLGVGLGNWSSVAAQNDVVGPHPHNIFLEMLTEGGVVAVSLWVAVVLFAVKGVRHMLDQQNPTYVGWGLVVVFAFFNALKTGSLVDNNVLFLGMGIVASARHSASSL